MRRTNVYVDGYNVYYGCLKGTAYRWLDLGSLADKLVPKHTVHRIRYFTAKVGKVEQDIYLRALGTIPHLSVHLGHYTAHPTRMPIHPIPATGPRTASVMKTEEKGSDVNLAAYLMLDAFQNDFEQAIVLSNDSDLETPIALVRAHKGLPVGVVFPCTNPRRHPSKKLKAVAAFTREVRETSLQKSLFLNTLTDASGAFHKPAAW